MKNKSRKPSTKKTKAARVRTRRNPYTGRWRLKTVELNPDAFASLADAPADPAPRSEIAQNIEAINSAIERLGTIRDAIGSYRAKVRELEAISAHLDALV